MKHPSADLETALTFVIERIGEEAKRSGKPLSDNERDFLRHLPTQPLNPAADQGYFLTRRCLFFATSPMRGSAF
jgi:hypothetical protein